MKLTKKLLSVLLAVLMITSSMSVCFGTFTFTASAAWEEHTEDPEEFLAYALNSDTVKNYVNNNKIGNAGSAGKNASKDAYYTTTIVTDNYADYLELRDIVVYIHKAILNTSNYKKVNETSDNADGNCTTFTGIKSDLITAINNIEPLSDAGKSFINYILADDLAVKHSDKSTTKQNNKVTNTLNIQTTDIKGYLKTVAEGDYTTIGSYENQISYYLQMVGKNGSSNLTYKDGCTSYYHHYMWGANWKAENYPPTTKTADASAKLTAYANYVNNLIDTNTFDVMATKTLAEIEALESNLDIETNTIKSNIADAGEGEQDKKYDQLFPGFKTKIDGWKKTASDAKDLATYASIVNDLAAYQAANSAYGTFNYGGFDEATIKADYADFMNTFGSLINNKTVYDYFVGQGKIDDTYVTNFRDNTIVYNLRDTIALADAIYAEYEYGAVNPDIDGEEEDSLKLQADASALTGYINAYNSYTEQVRNAIRADINYLLQLQEKFECTISACIVYFAERVEKDYTDVETQLVKDEITTAKNQLAALTALSNSVDYEANAPYLEEPFANADKFIAYLYQLLADRFTAQVENADAAFTSIGRPTENLSLAQFAAINAYIAAVDNTIVEYLDGAGQGALVSQATRNTFATLQTEVIPAFEAFKIDRGFQSFKTEDILIRREDNSVEYYRSNADLDNDGVGEYEVTDKNVADIIDFLEGALKDPTIAGLLGDLINKDKVTGEPTGEAFSLSGLVTGLLDDVVYTDNLVNTIVQYVYPLVCKEFAKVWAGLPETLTIEDVKATDSITADVTANLSLDDVETAIGKVGIYLSPKKLAERLSSAYPAYTQVINTLNKATTLPTYYLNGEGDADDTFDDPWADGALFTNKLDAEGNVVYDETTGRPVKVYALDWGIDSAENKKAAFVDAMCAALSGLEPLLFALLANQSYENADVTDGDCRGIKIGTGSGSAKVSIISLNLTIDPITLVFRCSANDGWDNALVPLFEALGLTNIPHSEDLNTTRKFLENGLLAMIEQLIAKLDANPIEFLLDALPNLAYMFEAGMIEPLLHQLKTDITYAADAYYSVNALVTTITGNMLDAMKSEEPIKINIGEMINLKDMGLDVSSFKAIWNKIAGGVELLANVEAPNAAYVATLGQLVEINSNRSDKGYTGGTAGKAYYIDANRADVLTYLLQWVLESGLLSGLVAEPSELITTIFANLEENSSDAIAAIVELLSQEEYPAKEYEWFNGFIDGESVVGNTAVEIYMNPNNDWTREKAEYLYNNLEAILTAALSMAGVEFDLDAIANDISGIFGDKTLTSLAALLAKLDLNALLAGDAETVAEGEEATTAPAIDVNALINEFLGLDLAAVAAAYADIAAAVEADPEYVHDFGVDAGTATFAEVLVDMLAPLSVVVDFILNGKDIALTVNGNAVTLKGADGYNNAIVPLLEALGCEVKANPENTLAATVEAVVALVDRITEDGLLYGVIDILPGLVYFITSNGLSTAVMNLLQPVLTIVDTIRPVFDVMGLINGLEIGEADENGVKKTLSEILGGDLDLRRLNLTYVFDLLPALVPVLAEIDLSGFRSLIYDICDTTASEYKSASAFVGTGMKAAYSEDFDQVDLLTVLLTYVLEWATVAENAEDLDNLLGTNGIIANINKVFADVEITYGTPDWYYWFDSEEAFNAYIAGNEDLPNTLEALNYPTNWTLETAKYFEENFAKVLDEVISKLEINGNTYASVSDLLNSLVYGDFNITIGEGEDAIVINYLFSDETINALLGLIQGILANIDDVLLDVGYILDLDIDGLKHYTCTKNITTIDGFLAELGYILDTYAKGLVNLLFFGDDIRIAKAADNTDKIVINGGYGYEKGLALILEALGCDVPAADEATVTTILAAIGPRVEEILANPVNEILDLLPNLVYFLNANGASVAVNNLLAPVYAIIDKINALGVIDPIVLNDILGFDLKYLSLADIINLVEEKVALNINGESVNLDLSEVEDILVDLCFGKLEKGIFTYKMTAEKSSVITVIATVAVLVLLDEGNSAIIKGLLGQEVYEVIANFLKLSDVPAQEIEWAYTDMVGETFSAFDSTIIYEDYKYNYGTSFTKERADYIADNFGEFVDNTIYLLGLDVDGDGNVEKDLTTVINDLLGGSLYNSSNVVAIQNLLVGIIEKITKLEVEGIVVGGYIADVIKTTGLADIAKVAEVKVPEFTADREQFVTYLCEILKPLSGLLKYLLADEDISFFVRKNGTKAITLYGAEGYATGIIPLLEVLGCEDVVTSADYYAALENGENDVLITSILNPLLNRVDEIIANPAEEILAILPNLIYFINSNGVDTVVKNTLNAVFSLLSAIEPIAKIDLYEIIGIDFADLDFNKLFNMLLDLVAEKTGYEFEDLGIDALSELSVGKLESYTSANGKTAYRMVYAEGESGTETEMVVTIERLLVTFIMHENNRDMLVGLLKDNLGMSDDAAKYVDTILDIIAEYAVNTEDGMDSTLYLIYTIYYVADTGVGNVTGSMNDINGTWKDIVTVIKKNDSSAGAIIDEILGWEIFEDVLDVEDGFAPNGIIKFFQKITDWFKGISEWFKNLFSFGK